jgi:hypothetical protein
MRTFACFLLERFSVFCIQSPNHKRLAIERGDHEHCERSEFGGGCHDSVGIYSEQIPQFMGYAKLNRLNKPLDRSKHIVHHIKLHSQIDASAGAS